MKKVLKLACKLLLDSLIVLIILLFYTNNGLELSMAAGAGLGLFLAGSLGLVRGLSCIAAADISIFILYSLAIVPDWVADFGVGLFAGAAISILIFLRFLVPALFDGAPASTAAAPSGPSEDKAPASPPPAVEKAPAPSPAAPSPAKAPAPSLPEQKPGGPAPVSLSAQKMMVDGLMAGSYDKKTHVFDRRSFSEGIGVVEAVLDKEGKAYLKKSMQEAATDQIYYLNNKLLKPAVNSNVILQLPGALQMDAYRKIWTDLPFLYGGGSLETCPDKIRRYALLLQEMAEGKRECTDETVREALVLTA